MAHRTRIRSNLAAWVNNSAVLQAEYDALDAAQFAAMDGDAGGIWSPAAPVIIGGAQGLITTGRGGNYGANGFSASMQAQNWPERSAVTAITNTLNASTPMAFLNMGSLKRLVAFDKGAASTHSYTSNDGIIWAQRTAFATVNGMGTVAAGVIGGSPALLAGEDITGNLWKSTDGATWTAVTTLADTAGAIIYSTRLGLWVVAAGAGGSGAIYTSPDTITWTTHAAVGSWGGKLANRIVDTGTQLVVATSNSYNKVLTSPDGVTWTERTVGLTTSWMGLAYGAFDGLVMLVNAAGAVYKSGDNGLTWASAAPSGAVGLNDLAVNQSLWVGPTPNGNFGGVSWSADQGATWQSICVGDHSTSLQGYSRILLADNRFIMSRSSASALEFALSLRSS